MIKLKPRFSIITLLLFVTGFAIAIVMLSAFVNARRDSSVRQIFGVAGVDIIRNADRVEAYRLDDLPKQIDWREARVSDYPSSAGPVVLTDADAKQVAAKLLEQKSYVFDDTAKACILRPGVRLDFICGADRLQILLCFECDTLEAFINNRFIGGEDFDNARPALVRAVQKMFPEDSQIKTLAEEH